MVLVTLENYKYLRSLLLSDQHYVNEEKLNILKHLYENDINSVRRLEAILTLNDLIETLEKRACVSEDDIQIFEDIGKVLNNRSFLIELEKRCKSRIDISPLRESESDNNFNSTTVKDQIYDLIINEIGRKWIDFARALNIHDSKLNQLSINYPNNYEMSVLEVLKEHEKNASPCNWKSMILDALTTARRNDLKKKVENIFNTHS